MYCISIPVNWPQAGFPVRFKMWGYTQYHFYLYLHNECRPTECLRFAAVDEEESLEYCLPKIPLYLSHQRKLSMFFFETH